MLPQSRTDFSSDLDESPNWSLEQVRDPSPVPRGYAIGQGQGQGHESKTVWLDRGWSVYDWKSLLSLLLLKDDTRMSLSSIVPDMREILRGMSIASDRQDEFITADDYYLQPQQHYVYDPRRSSDTLRKVSCFPALRLHFFFVYRYRHWHSADTLK